MRKIARAVAVAAAQTTAGSTAVSKAERKCGVAKAESYPASSAVSRGLASESGAFLSWLAKAVEPNAAAIAEVWGSGSPGVAGCGGVMNTPRTQATRHWTSPGAGPLRLAAPRLARGTVAGGVAGSAPGRGVPGEDADLDWRLALGRVGGEGRRGARGNGWQDTAPRVQEEGRTRFARAYLRESDGR